MKNHPLPNRQREKELERGVAVSWERKRKGHSMVRWERDGSGSAGVLWVPLLVLMAERKRRDAGERVTWEGLHRQVDFCCALNQQKFSSTKLGFPSLRTLACYFKELLTSLSFGIANQLIQDLHMYLLIDYLLHFYWVVSKVSNLLKIRPPLETTI